MWSDNYSDQQLRCAGVYAIVNRETGERYIGMTARGFKDRWYLHVLELRKRKHHCKALQSAWDECGEQAFEWYILMSTVAAEKYDEDNLCQALSVVEWREAQLHRGRLYNPGLLGRKPRFIPC
jgi:hypothetical protein